MNFKELFEGAEPSMPGAPRGIQIMTPQQFVARSDNEEVDENEEQVDVGPALDNLKGAFDKFMKHGDRMDTDPAYAKKWNDIHAKHAGPHDNDLDDMTGDLEVDEGFMGNMMNKAKSMFTKSNPAQDSGNYPDGSTLKTPSNQDWSAEYQKATQALKSAKTQQEYEYWSERAGKIKDLLASRGTQTGPALAESEEHLSRIRKLSGLDEATKLSAPSREFGSDEFQDYMKRIVGTPDIDKKTGQVKKQKDRVTKKGEVVPGKDKYISGKTKADKYKLPYIHRNSAVQYVGPDGQTYSEEKIIAALKQRPKSLLKQNEKMRHSNGEQEQFFNIGFAALTGIAVDEQTGKLIIVNTCPGAGSCKVDCFVIHQGGKIQFEGPWLNDGRILTYLLNDPDGFFNQLSNEISKEEQLGKKGGYNVTIRWHDSGDFFSPEYLDMALKMAAKHPNNKFYAYTKMAGAALAKKPDNFIINWSEGAHTSQEKQVKAQDPTLSSTKNSRIVPEEMFQDLLARDEKKNLVKGSQGQWQLQSGKLPELKERLAKQYGLSANSILSYDEYMAKRNKIPAGMKYNVIVMGGEGDVSANDPGVLSTLLLKH